MQRVICYILLSGLTLIASCNSPAKVTQGWEDNWGSTVNGLRCSFKPLFEKAEVGKELNAIVTLENVGDKVLKLYELDSRLRFDASFTPEREYREGGTHRVRVGNMGYAFRADIKIPLPDEYFTLLEPGKSISFTRKVGPFKEVGYCILESSYGVAESIMRKYSPDCWVGGVSSQQIAVSITESTNSASISQEKAQNWGMPRNSLRCSVELESAKVGVGDKIKCTVKLQNVEEKTLKLYIPESRVRIFMHPVSDFVSPQGKTVIPLYRYDYPPFDYTILSKAPLPDKDFTFLKPNESLSLTLENTVEDAGDYYFLAGYRMEEGIAQDIAKDCWSGEVYSEKVKVIITEDKDEEK